jgi:primosomal protein N' (replication factor Y)
MAPRFHTRDAVLILSTSHQSQLHLLDHTPSVETYYFSQKKVFVSGSESITALKTDQTTLITISSQNKQSILSETVIEKLTEKNSGIQFIFMHQRGSAHYIFCRDCNFVFSCPECHGSLTFHTRINELQCHTCKYHSPLFTTCFSCQGTNIAMYGTGTEAIEKELKKIFPERNIIRIDSDEPLSDQLIFKEKQTIVIGTQFAWNKLVWKDINLMIYADTDIALTIPEYKTNEHLWYSIRSAEYYLPEEAELYIQTRKPEHLVFSFLTHPEGFYEYELKERRKFKFPPFAYIIKLYYGGTTQTQGEQEAQKIKSKLQDLTNSSQNITISGPIAMKPHVRKKKYWYVLIVKVDYQYYKRDSKRILSHIPDQWKVDLNPNSLLSY